MIRKLRFHDFARRTDGTVSVEFILWVPIIFLFWFAAIQVSLLFMAQSTYWNVAGETARLVARHAIDTTEAVTYAQTEGAIFGVTPEATVTQTGDIVNVTISLPALNIIALNPLGFDGNYRITASINHMVEPI